MNSMVLFEVLEVKYDLDRTGIKKWILTAEFHALIGMWSQRHFLSGSTTNGPPLV